MPWEIFKHDNQFCLRNTQTKKLVAGSCHADREATLKMQRAMYANTTEPMPGHKSEDNMENDSLTYYGGAVKAMGGGKVGGYLIIFTNADSPDLQGDYFLKSTELFIENGETRPILYRHGAHPVIKDRKLGRGRLTVDDVGVFIEGELNLRDKYEKAIYTLAEKGKLGWSSGSLGYLVHREPNGKSFEIKSWPIGEASLTPNPVEGRTSAIPLKSLTEEDIDFDSVIKTFEQEASSKEFVLAGIPAIARFCEAVAPTSFMDGTQRSEAAADANKEFITIARVLGEAYFSEHSRLVRRSENRFVKSGREIDAATLDQIRAHIKDIEQVQAAFEDQKSELANILRISEMGLIQQKALDEQARFELWNFGRITGKTPEELENG